MGEVTFSNGGSFFVVEEKPLFFIRNGNLQKILYW